MKTIDTRQQLLIHLASGGDSSAFLTLFSGHLRASAIALRNQGKPFSEIAQIMFPMCKKLYGRFVGQRTEDVDEWFCSNWQGQTGDPLFERFAEQKELEEFEHGLEICLQREQSRFKAEQKKGRNGQLVKVPGRTKSVLVLTGAIAFLLVLVFSAMVFTNTSIEISFSRNGAAKKAVVPGAFLEQLIGDITGYTPEVEVEVEESTGGGDADVDDSLSARTEVTDEHAQTEVQGSDR